MNTKKFKTWLKKNRTGAIIGGIVGLLKISGVLVISVFFDTIFNFGGAIVGAGLLSSAITIIIYSLAEQEYNTSQNKYFKNQNQH